MSNQDALIQEMMQLEKEISKKQAQLVDLKKQAGQKVVPNYTFKGKNSADITLSALFGDQDELIVIHNMGRGCSYCTLWADGFNGLIQHLNNRASFVVVSPDAPEVQEAFAKERGWQFKMVSAIESDFTKDLGFTWDEGYIPGASTFKKQPDGTITRIGLTFFGPGDPFCGIWHLFDLLADGANGWEPQFTYV